MRRLMRAAFLLLNLLWPVSAWAQMVGVTSVIHAGAPAPVTTPRTPVAPPALPLASGARVMAFGDSHAGFNGSASTPTMSSTNEKGLVEAAWQIDPRFDFDQFFLAESPWGKASSAGFVSGANQGYPGDHLRSGDTRPGIVARLGYALSHNPQILWISAGTNSIATGDPGTGATAPASYVEEQLDIIIRQATARGIWVILPTLYPRWDAFFNTAEKAAVAQQVNEWIRAQAGRPGVKVYDPYAALLAPGSDYMPNPAYFLDGTHLNSAGVSLVARTYLVPLLNSMVSSGSTFDQNAAVANLWPLSTYGLKGTSGTKTGGNSTGSVATGYAMRITRNGSGVSWSGSKEAIDATYDKQVLTITNASSPAANWDQATFTFPDLPVSTSTIAAGSWLRAWVFVETPADQPAPNVIWTVTMKDAGGTVKLTAQGNVIDSIQYNSNIAQPIGRGGYWLRTPAFQAPADGDYATISATLIANWRENMQPAGQTMQIKLSKPILRLSGDPRGAWGL